MRDDIRKFAAHEIAVEGKETIYNAVVELSAGVVVNYYTFSGELPFTEWLGGRIDVREDNDGTMRAYRNGKPLG
ncbi:MAG: hypothetical protein SOZ80_09540 [Prevotella sp.]|uniref:hypothetical protein n=1 Tax=Prevotella sp. TaxID=59823 RepID=UPI002A3576E9|nr:hypothetical protein [Prevotella sp.]MDD7318114.1 hypothetical protein [Prevotellaceae bacterium]MDY4020997.1 hypothetical protein [Prevotella sp.]